MPQHAQYVRTDFADVEPWLAEEEAVRVSHDLAPMSRAGDVVRHWPRVPDPQASKASEFLRIFTSTKAEGDRGNAFVNDPLVDTEPMPGIWRCVDVRVTRREPGITGVIQTLRKGYLTSVDWDEAMVAALEGFPTSPDLEKDDNIETVDEEWITVEFRGVDPLYAQALKNQLRAVSSYVEGTNPLTIRNQAYSGTWYTLHTPAPVEQDGSFVVSVILAKESSRIFRTITNAGTPQERTRYTIRNIPQSIAQAIEQEWEVNLDASITDQYDDSRGLYDLSISFRTGDTRLTITLVTLWSELRKVTTEFHYGLSQAELEALKTISISSLGSPAVATQQSNIGRIEEIVYVREGTPGTYDAIVRISDALSVSYAEYVDALDYFTSRATKEYVNQTSDPVALTQTDGKIKSKRIRQNEGKTLDVTVNTDTAIGRTSGSKYVGGNAMVDAYEELLRNKTAGDLFSAIDDRSAWEAGKNYLIQGLRHNGFNQFDFSKVLRQAHEATASSYMRQKYHHRDTITTRHATKETEAPARGLEEHTKTLTQEPDGFKKANQTQIVDKFIDFKIAQKQGNFGHVKERTKGSKVIESSMRRHYDLDEPNNDENMDWAAALALFDSTTDYGSLTISPEGDTGLHTIELIKKELNSTRYGNTLSSETWSPATYTGLVRYVWQRQTILNMPKRRLIKLTFSVKYTRENMAAHEFAYGSGNTDPPSAPTGRDEVPGLPGSTVETFSDQYGPHGFRAVKITAIQTVKPSETASILEGGWENDGAVLDLTNGESAAGLTVF